nr:hypothetical protein [Bradyrhizobium sp. NAS96.2]
MKPGIGEFDAIDDTADRRALQPLLLHGCLQLLHRKVRCLQCQRGESCKPLGLRGAEFGKLFILDLHDLPGEVAIAVVPERVDREHLHIDGLRVHHSQALVDLDEGFGGAVDRRQLIFSGIGAEEGARLAEVAMRVNVDRLHALAVDADRQLLPRRLCIRVVDEPAAAEHDACCRRRSRFQEIRPVVMTIASLSLCYGWTA